MKFLITARPGATLIPPESGVVLVTAGRDWLKAKLSDGTLDCHYLFLGGGGFVISNADSHEDILSNLLEYPLYPFFVWEVTPLLDFEESSDRYIEFYQKIVSM